jgi:hypothetical protein
VERAGDGIAGKGTMNWLLWGEAEERIWASCPACCRPQWLSRRDRGGEPRPRCRYCGRAFELSEEPGIEVEEKGRQED